MSKSKSGKCYEDGEAGCTLAQAPSPGAWSFRTSLERDRRTKNLFMGGHNLRTRRQIDSVPQIEAR
jgi:hypothetical protein